MSVVPNTPEAWTERARSSDTSWDAAGWSAGGQAERFMAVLRNLRAQPGDSLLDFGCGTGAFASWLPPTIGWYGWDWAEGMRELARLGPGSRANRSVLSEDPVGGAMFDHVIAVGTFNLADGWSREQTWDLADDLWAIARKSLIISLYRGTDPRTMAYDPRELLTFAEPRARRWRVDATYRDNDVLLVMRR